jgi:hypothetical protein
MTTICYLHTIDINTVSKKEFDTFIENYKEQETELCFNKKENKTTQSLTRILVDDYDLVKKHNKNCKIIYIFEKNKEKILSFALINKKDDDSVILELLCSTKERYVTTDSITLGVHLLNHIYTKYLKNNTILKIEPATKELIPYYLNWKKPVLPIQMLNITYGYLIYCKTILIDDLVKIIYDEKYLNTLGIINTINKYLNIDESKLNELDMDTYKQELNKKIDQEYKDESINSQLKQKVESIEFRNENELKELITKYNKENNNRSLGGKISKLKNKSSKNKRKNKRKNKKTKKNI